MKLSILTLLLVCLAARLAYTQCSSECDDCIGSTCYGCYDGYALYDGYCYSCDSGCSSCYYESGTQQCTECSDSYALYDGYCYSCGYECNDCSYDPGFGNTCYSCNDGYDLSDGDCSYDCFDCDYDWWGNNWWIWPVVVFVCCFILAIVRSCIRRSMWEKRQQQMTANAVALQAPVVSAQAQAWNQNSQQPPMQNWNQTQQQPQWGWNQPGMQQQQQQAYYPTVNY